MEINIESVRIIKVMFKLDSDDELFIRCLYGKILFDSSTNMMCAITDCGNYSYQWNNIGDEDFISFILNIKKDYLLRKIAFRSEFNLEESKYKTLKNIINLDTQSKLFSAIDMAYIRHKINCIEDVTAEAFSLEAEDILGKVYSVYSKILGPDIIELIWSYPERAKTFTKIFCEYVQPELKKQLGGGLINEI